MLRGERRPLVTAIDPRLDPYSEERQIPLPLVEATTEIHMVIEAHEYTSPSPSSPCA
jgi:hypothetical protein